MGKKSKRSDGRLFAPSKTESEAEKLARVQRLCRALGVAVPTRLPPLTEEDTALYGATVRIRAPDGSVMAEAKLEPGDTGTTLAAKLSASLRGAGHLPPSPAATAAPKAT